MIFEADSLSPRTSMVTLVGELCEERILLARGVAATNHDEIACGWFSAPSAVRTTRSWPAPRIVDLLDEPPRLRVLLDVDPPVLDPLVAEKRFARLQSVRHALPMTVMR